MKKRILTVLITIITVIPLVLSVPKADAQTSTHTITSYGDYTFQQGLSTTTFDYELTPLAINLTWNSGSWMKLDYNFKDKYSGTMKFTVTSNQDWTLNSSPVYYSVYCDGAEATCYISATTAGSAVGKTKTFSVIFTNATAIHFNVATGYSATFFTSSNTITISNASFTTQPDLGDIYTDIHQLRTWWDLYIPGMSTNLSNITTNTSTMASDIAIIKSYLDGVEGYLDNIEPYLNSLVEYTRIRDSVDIPIYSRFAYINLLRYGELSDQYNYPYNTAKYGFFPTILTSNYSAPAYNSDYDVFIPAGKTLHFIYTISYWANIFDFIDNNSNSLNPTATMIEGNNYYRSYDVAYSNNGSSNIFVNVAMNRNVNRPVIPLYLGINVPADVAMLFNMDFDNYYTRLLQSINNGIGTLNSEYDTSQYESYEQTMDGLNDSMRDRFNNADDNMQSNIDTLFTPAGTAGSDGSIFEKFNFNGVNNLFTGILDGIFTSFPAFKYILIFALLLLVIGVMI